jgi:hypothetical protein
MDIGRLVADEAKGLALVRDMLTGRGAVLRDAGA